MHLTRLALPHLPQDPSLARIDTLGSRPPSGASSPLLGMRFDFLGCKFHRVESQASHHPPPTTSQGATLEPRSCSLSHSLTLPLSHTHTHDAPDLEEPQMDNLEEELMLVSPLNHFCFQRGSVRESACMGVGREEVKGGGRGGMKEGGRARHLARLSRHLARLSSLTTRCFYLSAERRCLSNQTEGSLTELSFSKHAGACLEACRRGSRSMQARVSKHAGAGLRLQQACALEACAGDARPTEREARQTHVMGAPAHYLSRSSPKPYTTHYP